MILPTLIPTPIEEHRAINRVAIWVATVRHKLEMRQDEIRAWLEAQLRERLRSGLTDRQKVIDAAEGGCKLSHEILMKEFHEMLDVDAMPPASLRAYAARADKIKHKRGRSWHHDYIRNVCICILIALATREFALMATRNREQRRARQPSGCSVVEAALARNNIHLDEGTVTNLWLGILRAIGPPKHAAQGIFSVHDINSITSCMTGIETCLKCASGSLKTGALPMTTKLRFHDLKARGIALSWAQLKRLQELYGFPRGRLLSPNCRIWDEEEEVNPWLDSRPVDGNPLRGAAKAKKARKAAAQSETEA